MLLKRLFKVTYQVLSKHLTANIPIRFIRDIVRISYEKDLLILISFPFFPIDFPTTEMSFFFAHKITGKMPVIL